MSGESQYLTTGRKPSAIVDAILVGDLVPSGGAGANSLGSTTYEWLNAYLYDDGALFVGADQDGVVRHKAAVLDANTALAGVLIGTPVTPALAANSLIIANATANGDILIVGNDGGHSRVAMFFDASAPDTILYNVGGTWSAGATAWTIPAVTLGGAVAGGDQAFTNVGDMTFAAGSIIASGSTNGNTLLFKANDTTFITLTTGATDTMSFGAFTLGGTVTGGSQVIDSLGHIGIGVASNAAKSVYISETLNNTAAGQQGFNCSWVITGTLANSEYAAAYGEIQHNTASNSSANIMGGIFVARSIAASSGNLTGDLTSPGLVGAYFSAFGAGSGSVTAVPVWVKEWGNAGGGGNVISAAGVLINSPYFTSALANAYGIYIQNITGAGTLNYAIYSVGGLVYFGGNVNLASSLNIGTSANFKRFYQEITLATDNAETDVGLTPAAVILSAAIRVSVEITGLDEADHHIQLGINGNASKYIDVAQGAAATTISVNKKGKYTFDPTTDTEAAALKLTITGGADQIPTAGKVYVEVIYLDSTNLADV